MFLEGRWERRTTDRICYYCGKEFSLNEVSKLQKKSRSRVGQSGVARRDSGATKAGVSDVRVPTHDLRVPEHNADTDNCISQEPGARDQDRERSNVKEAKGAGSLHVDPGENLRKVLERLKNG